MPRAISRVLAAASLVLVLAGAAGSDSDPCPASAAAPLIHRRSIAIIGASYGEGVMDVYPGIMLLSLHGTDYQMGYQHGAMLRDEIGDAVRRMKAEGGPGAGTAGLMRSIYLFSRLPEEEKEEIKGMAYGSGIDVWSLVRLNSSYIIEYEKGASAAGNGDPGLAVIIYHHKDGRKISAVARPGMIGAIAGMREQTCCLTLTPNMAGKRESSPDIAGVRSALRTGLCGQGPASVRDQCVLAPEGGGLIIKLDSPGGLICLSRDQGVSWSAADLGQEAWCPSCERCR
jgi:hypothetical protein